VRKECCGNFDSRYKGLVVVLESSSTFYPGIPSTISVDKLKSSVVKQISV
jgi:hypothetical protein